MNTQSIATRGLMLAVHKGYLMTPDGQCLRPDGQQVIGWFCKRRYLAFCMKDPERPGKNIKVSFHRLQAYQKFGDAIFAPGIEVRHIDGDPQNNRLDNIEIGTHSQNMMDQPESQRVAKARAASHTHHDQSRWEEVDAAREAGMSYKRISPDMRLLLSHLQDLRREHPEGPGVYPNIPL